MHRRLAWLFPVVLACVSALFAMDTADGHAPIKLVPAPKEVKLLEGGFRVRSNTKIFVLLGHQEEDRIAAETLAEEVADRSGLQLDIVGMKPAGKAEGGAIVLARLQDSRVRRFLAAKGLTAGDLVGEQGYLLFSDDSHLIVAANTGEGLFAGVQTLQQLLRPAGKDMLCPGIGIRDWPGVDWTRVEPATQDGLNREAALQFLSH